MAGYVRDISDQLKAAVDKDVRLKILKERQNEERHKKLNEIKIQALAAQRFKEQKEEERRRRLDDLKGKEDMRRSLVEERKRAIVQAEQDRLVSILRRNQEREVRIEAKKRNERSSIVFAFGSSTPRMLDPTDMTSSFWGQRRATSIQNIATTASTTSLTRRQSERDLDLGNKKRATSASGLERSGESSAPLTPAGCASGYVGRRRTDLMPTIPSRESPFSASRKSLNHSPGRAYSMSRLDQLAKPRKRAELPGVMEVSYAYTSLSSPRKSTVTRSMSHLAVSKTGPSGQTKKPLNKADSRSMNLLSVNGPAIVLRTTRASQLRQQKLMTSNHSEASSRPSSSLSQQSTTSVTSSPSVRHRPSTTLRRKRPASIAITGVTYDANKSFDKKADSKPPISKSGKSTSKDNKLTTSSKVSPVDTIPKTVASLIAADTPEEIKLGDFEITPVEPSAQIQPEKRIEITEEEPVEIESEPEKPTDSLIIEMETSSPVAIEPEIESDMEYRITINNTNTALFSEVIMENFEPTNEGPDNKDEMTTSMIKVRLNTEQEAKAALAERRRLAREEAERLATQERLRVEMEEQEEVERQRREEEQVQSLIEQQRIAEQERLTEAIKETQRREEEEKLRKEEELRSKLIKEEADKKAREEAERKYVEQQERLKNEEKEREARRKRVEAIMRRTRGMNANTPEKQNCEESNENKSETKVNGTKQENGTKNGTDSNIVDNIIPDETLKNANNVSLDTVSTDSINSNNTWQATQQYDPLV